jgi:hypothetical protein
MRGLPYNKLDHDNATFHQTLELRRNISAILAADLA